MIRDIVAYLWGHPVCFDSEMMACDCAQDVFLVDTEKFCFVWIGEGASPTEKKSGFGYAHVFIQ